MLLSVVMRFLYRLAPLVLVSSSAAGMDRELLANFLRGSETSNLDENGHPMWKANFEESHRKLKNSIEMVRQSRKLQQEDEEEFGGDELDDPVINDFPDEDEYEPFEVIDCASFSVTFDSEESMEHLHFPDNCPGYHPEIEGTVCDQDFTLHEEIEYPITCTFRQALNPDDDYGRMLTNNGINENDQALVLSENDEQHRHLSQQQGKHTEQYKWIAKAAKKLSYGEVIGSCVPQRHGRSVRGLTCYFHWGGWGTGFLLNCHCASGWEQVASDCWKPCSHYNDDYTQQIGYHCFKPCNREGQLDLNTGCGLGGGRTCKADAGSCLMNNANRAVSIVEVLSTVLSQGVAAAFVSAIRTGNRNYIRATIETTATEFANSLVNNEKIQQKTNKFKQTHGTRPEQQVFIHGAELFLASSIITEPDFGVIAEEISAAVDPNGEYGLVRGWIPPLNCDELVYMSEDIPNEEAHLPDVEPLDVLN